MDLPDHDAHLRAVFSLAHALKEWNERFDSEAREASARKPQSEHEVDDIISIYYDAGFADLARSHAFICTMAAFLESLFKVCLPAVGQSFNGSLPNNHSRVVRFAASPASFWDPRKPDKNQSGIAKHICEILEASGLSPYFGPAFGLLITAVFAYRNEMVHNGYEWDLDKRQRFDIRIKSEGWSSWFVIATKGNDPWFFTITPAFHDECLNLCNRAVLAFEGLTIGDWDRYRFCYAAETNISS